jgi:hypothetical protein
VQGIDSVARITLALALCNDREINCECPFHIFKPFGSFRLSVSLWFPGSCWKTQIFLYFFCCFFLGKSVTRITNTRIWDALRVCEVGCWISSVSIFHNSLLSKFERCILISQA